MLDATHIGIGELAPAGVPVQRALTRAWTTLVGVARIALVASILPVTVFIGWLAATEPAIMIGAALALAVWIGCDHESQGTRAVKPEPRKPSSKRVLRERRSTYDVNATASWS